MNKPQVFGMQIQAVCLPAIQLIPYYRGIQAKRMGRMDTQLMCAPGFRYERNKSTPRIIMQHSIISHGRFSVNRIDHLPRPVFRIRAEGEFNMTFFFSTMPSNQATYRLHTVRFLNCACKFWCTSFVLAIRIRPEVAMSSRCTIIGPVASGYIRRTRP